MFYREGKEVDIGGGTGILQTNHSRDFRFYHCKYSKFKGTNLQWNDLSFIISDYCLDKKELEKYTDEQCMEMVLRHISAEAMVSLISRLNKEAGYRAVHKFKEQLRKMIME